MIERIHAAGQHQISLAVLQFQHGEMHGAERTGAGRIYRAVRAAEIEAVRNASGDDVAEQARERVFLPFDILLLNPLHHILRDVIAESGVFQGFAPERMPKPRAERNDKFLRAGHAENHAGAAAIKFAPQISGIPQRFLRNQQAEKLRCVNCFQGVRDNAER